MENKTDFEWLPFTMISEDEIVTGKYPVFPNIKIRIFYYSRNDSMLEITTWIKINRNDTGYLILLKRHIATDDTNINDMMNFMSSISREAEEINMKYKIPENVSMLSSRAIIQIKK